MKRRDVIRRITEIAASRSLTVRLVEGGNHTVVIVNGARITTIPRHSEINELTAKSIIRQVEQA